MHPPSQFSYPYVPNSNLLATITTSSPLLTDHSALITSTNTYEPNRDVLDTKQNKALQQNLWVNFGSQKMGA